jgi:mannitol-1-phosphate 5-dehydrogenase
VNKLSRNKLVLFGAGKIGRSFIGQLFSRGGYEVVFIDISKSVIDELNLRHCYLVIIKNDEESVISIQNVRGVYAGDKEQVIAEIESARIVAVSVGLSGLKSTVPLIADGLVRRYNTDGAYPLDIIIAENLRNAAEFMFKELKEHLPEGYPLAERVGLIETSIGKMVPIMLKKDVGADPLQVFAEPYNTLILDKLAFKNPLPDIEGLAPKDNMKAWVDRKLFIHNLGHTTAAYLGYLAHPASTFLYEVLSDSHLREKVRNTMLQAADILQKKYPDEFTIETLFSHIDDLLYRFQNKALGDTIFRVGCDLQRKLSAVDRLAGAIHLALKLKLPYDLILNALVCGCHFNATDESGNSLESDIEFREIYAKGIKNVLTSTCGFDDITGSDVIAEAIVLDNSIKRGWTDSTQCL